MTALHLSSPAFADGEPIPEQYGLTAANVNPPLSIEGVPERTRSLALIVDDPDALEPAGQIWDHWIVWDIDPDAREIPEDWDAARDRAVEGTNDYGDVGYGGPDPPDREHTYRFRLYALESKMELDRGATKRDLERAMDGQIIDKTRLEGTFAP